MMRFSVGVPSQLQEFVVDMFVKAGLGEDTHRVLDANRLGYETQFSRPLPPNDTTHFLRPGPRPITQPPFSEAGPQPVTVPIYNKRHLPLSQPAPQRNPSATPQLSSPQPQQTFNPQFSSPQSQQNPTATTQFSSPQPQQTFNPQFTSPQYQ